LSDAHLPSEKNKTWKKLKIDLATQNTAFDLTGLYDGKYALLTADVAGNTSLQSTDTPQTITIDSTRPGIVQFAPTTFEQSTHINATSTNTTGYYNSFSGSPLIRGSDWQYLNLKVKMAEDGDVYLITNDVDSKDLYFNTVLKVVEQTRLTTQWRKVSGLANQTVNINLEGLAEGSYYLMSVDKAGNTSHDRDGDMPNVVIDNTRPTASTTSPTSVVYQTSEKKISVTSSEDGYGYMVRRADTATSGPGHTVDHQELYTEIFTSNDNDHLGDTNRIPDNAIKSMQLKANVAVDFDLTGLMGGMYSFVAVDRAGNTSHLKDGDLTSFTFQIKTPAENLSPTEPLLNDLLQTNGTILNGNEKFFVTKNLISHNDLDVLLNGGADTIAISGNSFGGLDRADTLVESSGKTWKLLDKAKLQTITDKVLLGTNGGEFWTSDMATDAGPDHHIALKLNAVDANSQMSWANSYAASDADLKYAVFQLA
jgi:hypothetical protein